MTILEQIDEAVQEGNGDLAVSLTKQAVDEGLPLPDILNCMVGAMDEIGRKYQCGEAYVPEMLFASRAMKEGIDIIEPLMAEKGMTKDVVAVIGTVQGDLHDLGKNLVIMMWKGANFEVIDLGVDVPPAKFVAAIKEHQPHLVGISSLLTTTMPAMKATVMALNAAGLCGAKTIVGGAPVSKKFAEEIGADAYAADAVAAVSIAREIVAI